MAVDCDDLDVTRVYFLVVICLAAADSQSGSHIIAKGYGNVSDLIGPEKP
jgi:hypothetical protein